VLTPHNILEASAPLQLAAYSVLAFIASFAGGWLLFRMRLTHVRLQMASSFVAGLMLGMALLHFLPHAARANHSLDQTASYVLAGFLLMLLLLRFFPHHHHDVSIAAPERSNPDADASFAPTLAERSAGQLSWVATAVGMTVHSLIGGMALAAAVFAAPQASGGWLGLGAALAIILHKPFDAMAVATLMMKSGSSSRLRQVINSLFALMTPTGAMLFAVGVSSLAGENPAIMGDALAFCAGTFLCIAGIGLLPEVQFHSHDRIKLSLALAAGVAIPVAMRWLELGPPPALIGGVS
jgi:zinc and cadmium transporter